ncbi:MAG: metalloregulator ArsR/SmtB family transcription factor, partial [Actinobacteria bacterium]|nr:metalloregulator ArsR/SmtB family transcription factor [Actinomycetota bacterium]
MHTDELLAGLRAAGEPTRLRLLALCAQGELTVSELTQILGQSQPRISRHLKLLCDAGLLDRFPEGTWAFYRLAERGSGLELSRALARLVAPDDPLLAQDSARLAEVKRARQARAEAYFRANAAHWNQIRSLHVAEAEVEGALLAAFAGRPIRQFLDIGTGTGRILELFKERAERGIGIDLSREMLAVARARLEDAGCGQFQVRHGDMYHLPFAARSVDAISIHQVLHYADEPAAAIREAARVLAPGGRLAVVDFAPHQLEELREEHAHRRLGFSHDEVAAWCESAGLLPAKPIELKAT